MPIRFYRESTIEMAFQNFEEHDFWHSRYLSVNSLLKKISVTVGFSHQQRLNELLR